MRCDLRVICERWHGTGERKLDMAARGYSYRQRTNYLGKLSTPYVPFRSAALPPSGAMHCNQCV